MSEPRTTKTAAGAVVALVVLAAVIALGYLLCTAAADVLSPLL